MTKCFHLRYSIICYYGNYFLIAVSQYESQANFRNETFNTSNPVQPNTWGFDKKTSFEMGEETLVRKLQEANLTTDITRQFIIWLTVRIIIMIKAVADQSFCRSVIRYFYYFFFVLWCYCNPSGAKWQIPVWTNFLSLIDLTRNTKLIIKIHYPICSWYYGLSCWLGFCWLKCSCSSWINPRCT